MEKDTNAKLTLDGKEITQEQLNEAKKNVAKGKKIVEDKKTPGAYVTLTRMTD